MVSFKKTKRTSVKKTSMNGDQQPAESQYVLLSFYGRFELYGMGQVPVDFHFTR